MKPKDVSERAWAFARKYQPDGLFADEDVLTASRTLLARAFDAATKDLRELADSLRAYAEYHIGASPEDNATLAAYTPEES